MSRAPLPPPPWVLVGLRGAGKSTLGSALARELGWAFVDLDAALERRAGRSIPELFASLGVEGFRDLEQEVLHAALELLCCGTPERALVASGGGVVERAANRRLLGALPVIYLHAAPATLARRVAADPRGRPPLLEGGPLSEAQALYARRDPLYRGLARHVVCAEGTPAAIQGALAELLSAPPA